MRALDCVFAFRRSGAPLCSRLADYCCAPLTLYEYHNLKTTVFYSCLTWGIFRVVLCVGIWIWIGVAYFVFVQSFLWLNLFAEPLSRTLHFTWDFAFPNAFP